MFTSEQMISFALFVASCEHDIYSDGKGYYKVKKGILLTEEELLP